MKQIFSLAFASEAAWEKNVRNMSGYKRKTTFFSDLAIAEMIGGEKAVKDTYNSIMKEWINNIEYITEFVLILNHKCWMFYDAGMMDVSKLYHDLYYESYNRVAEHFDGNNEAISYFFKTLD